MSAPPPRASRRTLILAALLLALLAGLTAATAAAIDRTADEKIAWIAARLITGPQGWSLPQTWQQGPLALYVNRLGGTGDDLTPALLVRARWCRGVFALLAGAGVFLWARRLFGDGAGLLALGAFALHPLVHGYGALITVDMAHAAGILGLVFLLARHAERPSLARAACAGAGLGACLGIKGLAALQAPLVAVAVPLCLFLAARARCGRGTALTRAAAGLCLAAASALLALHACYGFRAGLPGLDPALYRSGAMPALLELPGLGHALRLLPRPFVLGADMYLWYAAQEYRPFLNGSFAPGHPSYYLWNILLKTPEPLLLLGALALGLRLGGWLARGSDPRVRQAVLLIVFAVVPPFLYLSAVSQIQFGPRYVLPCLPLALVLCGGALGRGRPPPVARAALALGALWTAADVARQWPDGIGYMNRIGGGPAAGYRHFNDSSCDFGQLAVRGLAHLRADQGAGLAVLSLGAGPRFGPVGVRVRDLVVPDPEDPARPRHWLDPFEPVDHAGSSWLAFDVSPEAFGAAAAEAADERVRADLAVALLGAGRAEEARAQLGSVSPRHAREASRLSDLLAEHAAAPRDDALDLALARAWLDAGRADKAQALLAGSPARAQATGAGLLAQALLGEQRYAEAASLLAARGTLDAEPENVLLLDGLYRVLEQPGARVELLAARVDGFPEPLRGLGREALARAQRDFAAVRGLRR